MPGGGVEPPRAEARRILSSHVGSDPFRKFSTLLYFSTAYKSTQLNRCDLICTVLTMELLQFYYSDSVLLLLWAVLADSFLAVPEARLLAVHSDGTCEDIRPGWRLGRCDNSYVQKATSSVKQDTS